MCGFDQLLGHLVHRDLQRAERLRQRGDH
jgi:hypothetical protein